jgi:hypothetical protein
VREGGGVNEQILHFSDPQQRFLTLGPTGKKFYRYFSVDLNFTW